MLKKKKKQAHQFHCRGMLKSTYIFNVNGAIIAMYLQALFIEGTCLKGYIASALFI